MQTASERWECRVREKGGKKIQIEMGKMNRKGKDKKYQDRKGGIVGT